MKKTGISPKSGSKFGPKFGTMASALLCGAGVTLSFSAVLGLASEAQAADWESYGPQPIENGHTGRVISVAAHPTDPEILYAGAASGGVWKRENGKWSPLTDRMFSASIGALTIDPHDPNTIYAGTGEPTYATHAYYGTGIYRSRDGGKTWKVIGAKQFGGRTIGRILVHPKDPKRLFVAVLGAGTHKNHVGAKGPMGLFRSDDGGKNWKRVEGGLPDSMASDAEFSPDDPDTMYVSMASYQQKAGLYRSRDGGKTWKKIGGGALGTKGKMRFDISPVDPKRMYLVQTDPCKLMTSTDGGDTWKKIPAQGFRVQGWYDIDAGADPKDAKIGYFSGFNMVRTTNGGGSTQRITPPHVDLQAIGFDASGRLLSGGDGGFHRSKNRGSSWDVIGKGISNIQIYAGMSTHPTDPNFFIGGLQDNGTVYRDKDSLEWNYVLGGDGGYTGVHPENPSIVFAEIYGAGEFYRSTNGGRSFRKSASGITTSDRTAFFAPFVFNPKNPDEMYYATQRLYRSTNGGKSWSKLSGDVTGKKSAMRSLAISAADPKYIYAETLSDDIVASSDGGKTFSIVRSKSPGYPRVARALSAAPWDGKTVYKAVGAFGTDQIIVSRDAGKTWKSMDGDLPDIPANAVEAFKVGEDKTELVLLGTDRGVYLNCDSDGHWRKVGKLMPHTPIHDIRYDRHHKRIVVGTMGRGAWVHPEADEAFFRRLCMEEGGGEEDEPEDDTGGDSDDTGDTGDSSGGGDDKEDKDKKDSSGADDGSDSDKKGDTESGTDEDDDGDESSPEVGGGDSAGANQNGPSKAGCGCQSPPPAQWFWLALAGLAGVGWRSSRRH